MFFALPCSDETRQEPLRRRALSKGKRPARESGGGGRARGLLVTAAMEHRVLPPGIAVPSVTLTNIAKHHFARNYHAMVQNLQDIAGGLLVTAPFRDTGTPEMVRFWEGFPG